MMNYRTSNLGAFHSQSLKQLRHLVNMSVRFLASKPVEGREVDEVTHTGQVWDKDDYRRIRFLDKKKLVNKRRTELPRCTSQWTEDDLETLQIAVVQSRAYTPRELLSCIVNETIERRAARIKDHLMKYMRLVWP